VTNRARIVAASQVLAHVPDLVLSGSKPAREIESRPELRDRITDAFRTLDDAAAYLPNRVFIGADPPQPLIGSGPSWWDNPGAAVREGPDGVIFSQEEFLATLRSVDSTGLLSLAAEPVLEAGLTAAVVKDVGVERPSTHQPIDAIDIAARVGSLGTISWGYPGDQSLSPPIVLENLAAKASAALALRYAIKMSDIETDQIDLVISASEEAIGDRYQRGGGNLGKAVAEAVGANRASGFDLKNFCAAPISALVVASSLIEAGVANTVAVVAGGSLPKLGMKFQGHLTNGMPVLEDCLGAVATILSAQGEGPVVRHDAVGRHSVASGGSNPQIFDELVFAPLAAVGLKVSDVGLFGTELHNPELTEPQGSGNVPLRNYRTIAALAARHQHIPTDGIDDFLRERCVAGFAPTQGHIASAICLLPSARRAMATGDLGRAQLVAKGSLFLGRMSALSDGVSVLIEP